MIFSFYEIALMFFIYSFCGWCMEVIYAAVTVGKIENRGFLNGPICPIYGFGMIGVLMALIPVKDNTALLFVGGMAICTAIELLGGWILDKIFHMRWWDYSMRPYNIGGYVCPMFSLIWGIGIVLMVRIVHPVVKHGVDKFPKWLGYVIICVSLVVFVIDMIVTLKNLIGIKQSLGQLDVVAKEIHEISDQMTDVIAGSAIIVAEKAENAENIDVKERFDSVALATREKLEKRQAELEKRLDLLMENVQNYNSRLLNKLPTLNKSGKSINIKEYINSLKRK